MTEPDGDETPPYGEGVRAYGSLGRAGTYPSAPPVTLVGSYAGGAELSAYDPRFPYGPRCGAYALLPALVASRRLPARFTVKVPAGNRFDAFWAHPLMMNRRIAPVNPPSPTKIIVFSLCHSLVFGSYRCKIGVLAVLVSFITVMPVTFMFEIFTRYSSSQIQE